MTRDYGQNFFPSSYSALSDAEVVEAVVSGERERFELLVRRYNQCLFRVGMGYLNDHMDSEDAMQETYLKAFLNLHRFRKESSFVTWLTRIMINECLMSLRRRKRKRAESFENLPLDCIEKLSGGIGSRGYSSLGSDETKVLLEDCIARLPRSYRVVYMLRETQDLSTTETARILEISEQNVKVRLHRAREALKEILLHTVDERELFAYPAPLCDPFTARVMRAISSDRSTSS